MLNRKLSFAINKGIEVEYEEIPLAEEAIDQEIQAARESNASFRGC